MPQRIGQRELRNDNAEIMRRVERGERFVVTRSGKPVADLVPHQPGGPAVPLPIGELRRVFARLPKVDVGRWVADRRADDELFGVDDPMEDPWQRESSE